MSGIIQFENYCKNRGDVVSKIALHVVSEFRATVPKRRAHRPCAATKVTPELCDVILRLDNIGYAQHDIGRMLNVNQGRVNEVIHKADGGN